MFGVIDLYLYFRELQTSSLFIIIIEIVIILL